jgi:hypothetical protein
MTHCVSRSISKRSTIAMSRTTPPQLTTYLLYLVAPYLPTHIIWIRDIVFRHLLHYFPHSDFFYVAYHLPLDSSHPTHQQSNSMDIPFRPAISVPCPHQEFNELPASPIIIPIVGLVAPPSPDSTIYSHAYTKYLTKNYSPKSQIRLFYRNNFLFAVTRATYIIICLYICNTFLDHYYWQSLSYFRYIIDRLYVYRWNRLYYSIFSAV